MSYGDPGHEAWLMELEAEDDARGYEPLPSRDPAYGGCGCAVSMIYGGDCAHTLAGEFDEPDPVDDLETPAGRKARLEREFDLLVGNGPAPAPGDLPF